MKFYISSKENKRSRIYYTFFWWVILLLHLCCILYSSCSNYHILRVGRFHLPWRTGYDGPMCLFLIASGGWFRCGAGGGDGLSDLSINQWIENNVNKNYILIYIHTCTIYVIRKTYKTMLIGIIIFICIWNFIVFSRLP